MELRRVAIAASDASLKRGKPVAAPVPAYFDSGEMRFHGEVLYAKQEPQKINRYAGGIPGRGVGTLPMFDLSGNQVGGAPLYKKAGRRTSTRTPNNPWGGVPSDERKADAELFLRQECKTHGTRDKKGEVVPCKRSELPAACLKTAENLRAMKNAPEAQTLHAQKCSCNGTVGDPCSAGCSFPCTWDEVSITAGISSDRSVWEKTKQGVLGKGFATRSSDSVYPEPRHLSILGPWLSAQETKERLVQHYYHDVNKRGDYAFVAQLWQCNLPNVQRRKEAKLPLIGGDPMWVEKWPAGSYTGGRRPRGKLYEAALAALPHHTVDGKAKILDSTYASLAQSDVAEWCRLNAVQVALLPPHKAVRDMRDGVRKEQQQSFENVTKELLCVSKAGKLYSVKSRTGYKLVDRTSKPKVDAYEYVNYKPALILSKDLVENDADYHASAEKATEIRSQLNPSRLRLIDGDFSHMYSSGGSLDEYGYTTWILNPACKWFADEVKASRKRVAASAKHSGIAQLDPLRSISDDIYAVVTESTDNYKNKFDKKKREKGAVRASLIPFGCTLTSWPWPLCHALIAKMQKQESIVAQQEPANTVIFPSSRRCGSGSTYREVSSVRDLNLTSVSMADRMGAHYNVVDGVWQQFLEGWHPRGLSAHQLQRTRLEQLFRGMQNNSSLHGWTVSAYDWVLNTDPSSAHFNEYVWSNCGREVHNVQFFTQASEFASSSESCTCWHCGEKFLTYNSLQAHVDKHSTCKTFVQYCISLRDKDGTVSIRNKHYGVVKFVRVLPSDESRAWITKGGGYIGVDTSTLNLKNGEDLKGSETFKWLTKNVYAPPQEPSHVITMSEEQTEMLHNYLCVVYPNSKYNKALCDFRGYRREQGYNLLTDNTYQFFDALEERKAKKQELGIKTTKDTTEEGVRWCLRMSRVKPSLSLGVIGSPERRDVPSKNEVHEHCVAKARESQDNPKLSAEWAAWVIKAHVCRLAGATWYDGGDDMLSAIPQVPTSFVAKLAADPEAIEPVGTLAEELDE
jgi:hypothetical protein